MPASTANYGFDAPGFIRGFLGSGAALLVTGFLVLSFVHSGLGSVLSGVFFVAAAAALSFGCMMVAYGLSGKMRTRDRMFDLAPLRGDEHVLDIGTGSGLLAVAAAKRLTSGSVTGIDLWVAKDLSNSRQQTTERNIALEGLTGKIQLKTADARRLPFADGDFDRVVSLLCLHNIEPDADQASACREISRVLRPGGVVVIGDYLPTTSYATSLTQAGMNIRYQSTAFTTALSLMWLLIAEKPVTSSPR